MTQLEVYELKSMLRTMLNSLGRVESRIAVPAQSQLADMELKIREARRQHLPAHYAGDPAWDILLCLDRASRRGGRYYICDLEAESETPATTVLRYLTKLDEDGLIERIPSDEDRRRVEVRLTGKAVNLLQRLFDDAIEQFERPQRLVVAPLPAMIG